LESPNNPWIARLPVLPKNVLTRQNSSYHRSGINQDSGNFLYTDENGESVVFDASGPGCIRSIFSTNILKDTVIKFYFDGAAEPRYNLPIREFFSGTHPHFPAPMVSYRVLGYYLGADSKGGNCLLPIAFEKALKITISGDRDIFYHILWEQYPYGENPASAALAEDLSAAREIWSLPGGIDRRALENDAVTFSLPPGKKESFFHSEEAGCISALSIESGCIETLLNDVYVCMRWDDHLYDSVHAPLGHFFGVPAGAVEMNTPILTVTLIDDFTVRLVCRWPMPYWKNASLSLLNLGKITVPNVRIRVETTPPTHSTEDCGYFSAFFHSGLTQHGQDWILAQAKGWGKYVGTVQKMLGEHYCEGDEHFYLDGASTPQINGTGTEDYYLFCFWPSPRLCTPFNGSTTDVFRQGGGLYANSYHYPSAYYRFHLDCPIAFYAGIDAMIQHGGMSHIHSNYSSLALCYLRKTPALALSDSLDTANLASRQMHAYHSDNEERLEVESSFIGNHIDVRERHTGCEVAGGEIRFQIAIDPANQGVMLRRRIDQIHGRQKAEVRVDGNEAGTWYDANTNPVHRWHDSDFLLPPALCAGKSQATITLKVENTGLDRGILTIYGIQVFSFIHPPTAIFNERQAILGEYASRLE
jgi:hypothetical protein